MGVFASVKLGIIKTSWGITRFLYQLSPPDPLKQSSYPLPQFPINLISFTIGQAVCLVFWYRWTDKHKDMLT